MSNIFKFKTSPDSPWQVLPVIKGQDGPVGPQGPQGEVGPVGPAGPQGPQGKQGETGSQGLRGPQGPQGPQGKEGKTPVKGVDYFTDADIKKIAAQVEAPEPDLSNYYTRSQTETYVNNKIAAIPEPDLTSYATKTYVNNEIAKAISSGEVDLTDYYTKAQTDNAINKAIAAIPETDLSDYAKKSDIPDTSGFALKTEIPSVPTNVSSFTNDAEYTNKAYVDNAIAQAVTGGQVDLSNYYTKSETNAAIEAAAPDLSGYALKTEIPDTTGLASEQYVQDQIAAIPETDLSDYATISYVNTEIAKVVTGGQVDLSNYYTKNETNAAIEAAKPDLSGYALKTEIPDTSGFTTEARVNELINAALGVIENGTY